MIAFLQGPLDQYFLLLLLQREFFPLDLKKYNNREEILFENYNLLNQLKAYKFNGVVSGPHFSMTILIQIVEKCSQHCSSSLFEPLVRVLLL